LHDAFTRLLQRQPPDTDMLWIGVKDIVQPQNGFLVILKRIKITANASHEYAT